MRVRQNENVKADNYLTGNFEAKSRVYNESGVSLFKTTLTVGKNGWLLLKSSLSLSKRLSLGEELVEAHKG